MRYWLFGAWCFFVFTAWISHGYASVWEMAVFLVIDLIVFIYPAALLHYWRCAVANRTQIVQVSFESDMAQIEFGSDAS